MSTTRLFRVALSGFILFHLFAVVLAPNSETYLGESVRPVVLPYLKALGLGSRWSFFAPDPGPPPIFIEYELLGENERVLGTGRFPEKKDPYFFRDRQNRRIALVRFLSPDNALTEKTLGPMFCKAAPGALSVRLWKTVEPIPNLFHVANGLRRLDDGKNIERKWVGQAVCL